MTTNRRLQRKWMDVYHEGELHNEGYKRKQGDEEEMGKQQWDKCDFWVWCGHWMPRTPTLTRPNKLKKKHQILGIQMRY